MKAFSQSGLSVFDVRLGVCVCLTHSQVTQEICDPSRVFRLLGSDRLVLLFSAFFTELSEPDELRGS